jgi:signal transduction histidine kinase/ActR/RegA family two-component response regulator
VSAFRLRWKILLALLAVSAGLTCGTLAVVRYTVQNRVRDSLWQQLYSSVQTYRTFQAQQEESLVRSAQLLASLPTVRALMSTQDPTTIRDASGGILKESGADLLVLADRRGVVCSVESTKSRIPPDIVQYLLNHTFEKGVTRDWWLAEGRLYQIVTQPVEFGQGRQNTVIGILVTGHEIDQKAAQRFSGVIGNDIVFRTGGYLISSRPDTAGQAELLSRLDAHDDPFEIQLGHERFLAATEKLYSSPGFDVSITVLKSFDQATEFLSSLNRVLVALGLVAILSGMLFGYLISDSITKPLGSLVQGVQALEKGDFDYSLASASKDEVGVVAKAFERMRLSLRQGQEEQKQLEQRLRQAHKMEAVGRLAGGVAHDFNNLLTIIRGHADLLSDRAESDSQRKSVEQIQKAANRAVGMTRQLLAFSRMQVLQPRVVDLNAIITEMGKMLPRLIGEHIEYSFSPQPDLMTVQADPGQIEQVLMNLAVNARDAMPDGGKLQVRTANMEIGPEEAAKRPAMVPGSYALISVSDTGHGMDEETKAHIFEPFFTTKEVGKGTGLGLATVYGIVKQSRGFIWVHSTPGHGTTFEIFFPGTTAAATASASEVPAAAANRGSETILLVEDEPGVRDLAHEFLKQAGYKVLEANDGAEALEVAGRYAGTIDLLLTDMVMPRISGKELMRILRETRPGLKVVMMSGYSEFSADGKEGAEFFSLAKPFSMSSLVEKLDEVLHKANLPEGALKN